MQRRSTRDEHAKRRPAAEQPAHELCRAEEMLEVVDHEESIEVGDGLRERLLDRSPGFLVDLERLRDRRGDQPGIRDGAELDDDGVGAGERSSHREREARLPRAAGARQRHEPRVVTFQQGADCCDLERSPHELRTG